MAANIPHHLIMKKIGKTIYKFLVIFFVVGRVFTIPTI